MGRAKVMEMAPLLLINGALHRANSTCLPCHQVVYRQSLCAKYCARVPAQFCYMCHKFFDSIPSADIHARVPGQQNIQAYTKHKGPNSKTVQSTRGKEVKRSTEQVGAYIYNTSISNVKVHTNIATVIGVSEL